MKAYGHKRRDKLTCRFGCCQEKGGKSLRSRDVVDRAARKRGRQFRLFDFLETK